MKKKHNLRNGILLTLGVLASVPGTVLAKDDDSLKVGVIKALGTVSPYVAEKEGYFDGLNIEFQEFSDGSALMEAFAAGELDLGFCGVAPIANWYTKGIDLKVIAGCNGGGHVILTREDTGIESASDLKGKTLAEPNIGTVTDTLLRDVILPEAELDPETDLTIIPGMKPADMAVSLFDTKEVDAILTWEPFVTQAQEKYEGVKIVYDAAPQLKEKLGTETFYSVNALAATSEILEEKPEEVKAFVDAYKQGVDYINENEEANAVIAEILEQDESVVEGARERIDYTYEIDKEGIERTLQWALDLGYIDEIPSAEEFYQDTL